MIVAKFVDLVENEDWIVRLDSAEGLDDLPGHCANIGAAVAAHFCFVAHSAKRDSGIFST